MQSLDDLALLREYAANNSEAAFAELVSRRVGFVYTAALRQVRDPHLAEEITQAVFIILAQKAGKISDKTILAGWLFKTTRYAAIAQTREAIKRSQRKATIEQEAQMQTELSTTTPDPLWEQMSPLLDEALAALGETDRQAVLLRFFENKSLAEVANELGTGEDTARKRVTRALEKLHRYFNKRGVSSTTAILAGVISTNSVSAAPVTLAKSVTAVALAKGAAASGSTLTLIKGALKIMAWTKAKTAVAVGVGVLLAAGTTTVAVKEVQRHQDEAWQLGEISLDGAPQKVAILPTKSAQRSQENGTGGMAWTADGKVLAINESVESILPMAYFPYGTDSQHRVILNTAMPEEKYDFLANLPNGSMQGLQQALQKKFGLAGHLEKRDTSAFALRLKQGAISGWHPSATSPGRSDFGQGYISATGGHVSDLVAGLEKFVDQPVIDDTGLMDRYDFNLTWNAQSKTLTDEITMALLDQLGLELVPTNMPIEMLVVEKVK